MPPTQARKESSGTRFDLWSLECWRQHRNGREMRRTQLRETVNALDLEASDPPLIVGGDFNAAGGDAIFRLFKGRLKDAFKEAGLGWGNTAINVCPVARPDQVWVGRRARSLRSWVKVTEHSDHRMVLCDLAVPLSR